MMRILIVDDQRFIRESIKADFSRCLDTECVFIEAESGYEAISIIGHQAGMGSSRLDLIVVDLKMEDGDGLAVIDYIATNVDSMEIPLAIISSSEQRTLELIVNIIERFKLNLVGVYQKPVDVALLLQQLRALDDSVKPDSEAEYTADALPVDQLVKLINDEHLILCYQPKIDIASKELVGFEVLARLCQNGDGFIYPDKFIPPIMQLGLGTVLAKLVLQQAITHWQLSPQLKGYALSVNITVEDLIDPDFIEFVINKKLCIPDTKLILELTESHDTLQQDRVLASIAKIIINDISISLDDFGKSYSTFDRLDSIPFDEIKIDKSFVSDLDSNNQHLAIVKSTIALANTLKIKVVAEGVETLTVLNRLKHLGCNLAQGYYFSPPIEGRYVSSWVEDYLAGGLSVVSH